MSERSQSIAGQAFQIGWQASKDGLPIAANPYPDAGDIRAGWWEEGWLFARDDYDEIVRERLRARYTLHG